MLPLPLTFSVFYGLCHAPLHRADVSGVTLKVLGWCWFHSLEQRIRFHQCLASWLLLRCFLVSAPVWASLVSRLAERTHRCRARRPMVQPEEQRMWRPDIPDRR